MIPTLVVGSFAALAAGAAMPREPGLLASLCAVAGAVGAAALAGGARAIALGVLAAAAPALLLLVAGEASLRDPRSAAFPLTAALVQLASWHRRWPARVAQAEALIAAGATLGETLARVRAVPAGLLGAFCAVAFAPASPLLFAQSAIAALVASWLATRSFAMTVFEDGRIVERLPPEAVDPFRPGPSLAEPPPRVLESRPADGDDGSPLVT